MSDRSTIDTNIAVYALTGRDKAERAWMAVESADFISVQLLSELVNVSRNKLRLEWDAIDLLAAKIRQAVGEVLPILSADHAQALRLARRHQLSFYDSLMLAVALSGGARIFYSEDMQHGMLIDGTLRIVDPYRPETLL